MCFKASQKPLKVKNLFIKDTHENFEYLKVSINKWRGWFGQFGFLLSEKLKTVLYHCITHFISAQARLQLLKSAKHSSLPPKVAGFQANVSQRTLERIWLFRRVSRYAIILCLCSPPGFICWESWKWHLWEYTDDILCYLKRLVILNCC